MILNTGTQMELNTIQRKKEMGINFNRTLLPNVTDILAPDIEDLIFVELAKELIRSKGLDRSTLLIDEAFKLHLDNYISAERYTMLQRLFEQQELMIQLQTMSGFKSATPDK